MDPITAISAIASVLGLVDKFVTVVDKLRSQQKPFQVEAKQDGSKLVITHNGQTSEVVRADQLNMSQFDETRFNSLNARVTTLWNQFNGIYSQLPLVSVDEQFRLKERMEQMRKELCQDFREMVEISEKVLGVPLSDHYSLYRTCAQ